MQIDIDFEVFKELTALRRSESDSYNHVIRRLLDLPPPAEPKTLEELRAAYPHKPKGLLASAPRSTKEGLLGGLGALEALGGAWFNGVHLPEGTQFRATYKGTPYFAEIKDGKWVDGDGVVRTSPSDAASAISNTNVNGWRFWRALRPGDSEWQRLDEFRE